MKHFNFAVSASLFVFAASAAAGTYSHGTHLGESLRTYDLTVESPEPIGTLEIEADANAREKCPRNLPIQRISGYQVEQRRIPYSTFLTVYVQAVYGCGRFESDF